MKNNIKTASLNQAVRRANLAQKNGTQKKRVQLEPEEIERIRELRKNGNTLAYIAKFFNRSIRTIEKHTKDIDKYLCMDYINSYKESNIIN